MGTEDDYHEIKVAIGDEWVIFDVETVLLFVVLEVVLPYHHLFAALLLYFINIVAIFSSPYLYFMF